MGNNFRTQMGQMTYVWARKILGFSYEGFEQEVLDLFSTIESSCKGYKGTSGSFRKEIGSGVEGVRELLNLSCSMNYDTKKNPPKPPPSSRYRGKASTPL